MPTSRDADAAGRGVCDAGLGAVVPGQLYVGGLRDLNAVRIGGDDAAPISPLPVAAFVSVASEVTVSQLPEHIQNAVSEGRAAFLHVPLRDAAAQPLVEAVKTLARFVDEQRATHGRATAVVCREGRSRSAACVAGYLMLRQQISFDEALAAVRRVRCQADPNISFIAQLSALSPPEAASSSTCSAGGGRSSYATTCRRASLSHYLSTVGEASFGDTLHSTEASPALAPVSAMTTATDSHRRPSRMAALSAQLSRAETTGSWMPIAAGLSRGASAAATPNFGRPRSLEDIGALADFDGFDDSAAPPMLRGLDPFAASGVGVPESLPTTPRGSLTQRPASGAGSRLSNR